MLRKFLPLVVIFILLLSAIGCTTNKQLTLTAGDNGRQVEIEAGGKIVINLEGNPSTGYTWEAKDLDTSLLEQVGDPVFISTAPGLVGSGGTLTLTFKSLKAGITSLKLVYHRPWEPGVDPLDTFTITVTSK
jgi:inhibitor of cysteine peptidase